VFGFLTSGYAANLVAFADVNTSISLQTTIIVALITTGATSVFAFGGTRLNAVLDNRRKDEGVRTQVRSMLGEVALLLAGGPAITGRPLEPDRRAFFERFIERAYEADTSVAFHDFKLRQLYKATTSLRTLLRDDEELKRQESQHGLDAVRRRNTWPTVRALLSVLLDLGDYDAAVKIGRRLDSEIRTLGSPKELTGDAKQPLPEFEQFLQKYQRLPTTNGFISRFFHRGF
jgi:hypothetical protein